MENEIVLTKSQKEAVERTDANLVVAAGAGSGKTRVLVERFIHLVRAGLALPGEILTLTFTDKAAAEMKRRTRKRFTALGMQQARRDLESAYISTIHAFTSRVLKEHPVEAGIDPEFTVLEEEEADLLRDQALEEVLESACVPGSETFELLRVYGEKEIRGGIQRVFEAARVEGLMLAGYFARAAAARAERLKETQTVPAQITALIQRLGAVDLLELWQGFAAAKNWDWETFEAFREWRTSFSRRSKGGKEVWDELRDLCKLFAGMQAETLLSPWAARFEPLAISFEAAYEKKKQEKAALDFDDLQRKAVELFTSQEPGAKQLLERYRRLFKFILVDECQDTNRLQMRLLELLSSPANLFLVGDFKQSIYSFRGTLPEHFRKIEEEYRQGRGGACIPMLENFRAEPKILEFLNHFFGKLWEEDGLVLEPHKPGPRQEKAGKIPPAPGELVDLLVTQQKEDEPLDLARMREADFLAQRLKELAAEGFAWKDMVILFQAMTNVHIYEQALKNAEIPYFVVAGRGFYHQPEIRDMLSFLACLENPLADIPLAATLRAPFFNLSDDALFWLARRARETGKDAPLYAAVKSFETLAQISADQKERLACFRSIFKTLLAEKDRLRLAELIEKILDATAYELSVLADPKGARQYANLRKLVEMARDFEAAGMVTLGDFIRTIKNLESREARESQAQMESEEDGSVVRLMSIHQAKGLEAEVVAVADLGRKDTSRGKFFAADGEAGYAFKIKRFLLEDGIEPLSWHRIWDLVERRETEEWKRLLYVAMTRAEKRLVLSGVYEAVKEPKEFFRDMPNWMHWMMTAAPDLEAWMKTRHAPAAPPNRGPQAPAARKNFQALWEDFAPQPVEKLLKGKQNIESLKSAADAIFQQLQPLDIPAPRAIDLPVSAFAAYRKSPEEYFRIYELGLSATEPSSGKPETTDEKPAEAPEAWEEEEAGLSAADFGTAIHRVLQYADFKAGSAAILSSAGRALAGMSETNAAEAREILKRFAAGPVFARLARARRIYRELPFILNERHGRIYGVIDVLFEDESGWHVLDYKTAVGDEEKIRKSGYDLQAALYSHAASVILKALPRSAVLYFLKNDWSWQMDWSEKSLAASAAEIRRLQEEIVEYRIARQTACPSGNQVV